MDQQWYDCNDSQTSILDSIVITKAAYLLFYRRRNHVNDDFQNVLQEAQLKRRQELQKQRQERQEEQNRTYAPISGWQIIDPITEPLVNPDSAVATATNSSSCVNPYL